MKQTKCQVNTNTPIPLHVDIHRAVKPVQQSESVATQFRFTELILSSFIVTCMQSMGLKLQANGLGSVVCGWLSVMLRGLVRTSSLRTTSSDCSTRSTGGEMGRQQGRAQLPAH